MSVSVRDIVDAVFAAFPREWAEPWDNVGLSVGDPEARVGSVIVSLDPTAEVVRLAEDGGYDVVVTHHPVTLSEHRSLVRVGGTRTMFDAARSGVALIAAHTNLDRAPGACDALVGALGLPAGDALEDSLQDVDVVTVFAPAEAAEDIRSSLAGAGAGRIGRYLGAAFHSGGRGSFVAGPGADPAVGAPGEHGVTDEERIEMVAPPGAGRALAEIAARRHPYEEPLIVVTPARIRRGAARLGRVCDLDGPRTLSELVAETAARLDCTPRVWGEPAATVERVAVATGSAGSLVPAAIAAGADVLIGGEVRYHDALGAVERGLAIVEAGHDVTEWPLVPVLAEAVRATPGLDPAEVHIDPPRRGWWTP